MHLNNNIDYRRYADNGCITQQDYPVRYGNRNVSRTPDKQILQRKDTNIEFPPSSYHNNDQLDNKFNQNNNNNNNIWISSPMSKNNNIQVPSSPYTTNSPFKKITGIKKTPNGKQNSFHTHHQSSFVESSNGGNIVFNNSNYQNNSQQTTLNTTDASFSQFLNQTANRNNIAADQSNISVMSSRRQAVSLHSQAQMGLPSPQNSFTGAANAIQYNQNSARVPFQQNGAYKNSTPNTQALQQRNHHSVYASPINHDANSSYLDDSGYANTQIPQSSRQNQTPYQRNHSSNIQREQSGTLLYQNLLNESQNTNNSMRSNGQQNSIEDNGSNGYQKLLSNRQGHNKNHSCYTPSGIVKNNPTNHNNSYNSNYDNYSNPTTQQINQIENIFNQQQKQQGLSVYNNHSISSTLLTPQYKSQNQKSHTLTPRQNPTTVQGINYALNSQIQQIQLNNQMNNTMHNQSYSSQGTPNNNSHKHQNSCFQTFEYYNKNNSSINNQQIESPVSGYGINVDQQYIQPNHIKSNSLHQQKSAQSFNNSQGSVTQSNFLQNSAFMNHIQKHQLDSKSTFNPSSNFGSIAQNNSGFINSQSSFLNSNGTFVINNNNHNGNLNQVNNINQYVRTNQINQANNTLNGMLGQQSLLNKGPQLQKIIDDLKENIVKDLESLTNKLYKESESIINSQGNAMNTYESIHAQPIQLAEYNLGDDKKVRFSFSGREVITQITSTNMKLRRDVNDNKENILQTYTTPLTSSQFLSPFQQQILSEQILSSGIQKMRIQTPRNSNKNIDSSTALHTFSSPTSNEHQTFSSSNNNLNQQPSNETYNINLIPTHSPANNKNNTNIKRPSIFNNPSKLFEKGNKDNSSFVNNNSNTSYTNLQYGQEDTPSSRQNNNDNLDNEVNSFQLKFENAKVSQPKLQSQEDKLFEEFFRNNNDTQNSKDGQIQNNEIIKESNTASAMVPELEKKQKNNNNINQNIQKNQQNQNSIIHNQQEIQNPSNKSINQEQIEQQQQQIPVKEEIKHQIQEKQNQDLNNAQIENKNDNNSKKIQTTQIAASTPQKKESKVMNTEESENAPGKLTPCFQSSKSKNPNKNAVSITNPIEKTQSDEKSSNLNTINGLTPFCLKIYNSDSQFDQQNNTSLDDQKQQSKSDLQSQILSNTGLIKSQAEQEKENYENELKSLTQNMSIQNKSDNLSDQDDVVLRTDNTDQLSEGSPKLYYFSSNRQSKQLDPSNKCDSISSTSSNKIPLSQFQTQLENIHEKECESGSSTPNTNASQQLALAQQKKSQEKQEQDLLNKKKSSFAEIEISSTIPIKEEQPVMKFSQTLNNSTNNNNNNNSNHSYSSLNNNETTEKHNIQQNLQLPQKIDSQYIQDHCSYRGSAKSSQSSSSAQNRYQDSALSSRKQSFIDNNNDSSYLSSSNINNNNNSFTSTPGSNLKSSRYQQNSSISAKNNNNSYSNLNNTSTKNKNQNESSSNKSLGEQNFQNQTIQNSNSATNIANAASNIRFSTYLKQHEGQKSQTPNSQNSTYENKTSNNNNTSFLSNISNNTHSPINIVKPSPIITNNQTPKQFIFKNKSNLSLFEDYKQKMKTPTKQEQGDLELSQNSTNNQNQDKNTSQNKPKSFTKLHFNEAQMNKLQQEKQNKFFDNNNNNDDEVHTSRENPLEQIRENTTNTQENEDTQFLAFQNLPSALTSDSKKLGFNDNSSILKPIISTEVIVKKDPPRPLLLDSQNSTSNNLGYGNFFNPNHDKMTYQNCFTPLNINPDDLSSKNNSNNNNNNTSNKLNSTTYKNNNGRDETSSASSYKQNSSGQQSSSSYYNFYESTQKLIDDSVIIQNKKNDLSSGNISKYNYSSSQSKSNNTNNISGSSNQNDASKLLDNSHILRNVMDQDDDDALLNMGHHLENNNHNKLNNNNQEMNNQNTPEKIKKSPNQNNDESTVQTASFNMIDGQKDNQNDNKSQKQINISNMENKNNIQESSEKKRPVLIEDDTPSSTVNFQDNSDSTSKKRAQFTFNLPNEQNSEVGNICRNLKSQLDQEYQYIGYNRQNQNNELLSKQTSISSSSSECSPSYEQLNQKNIPTLQHSATTPSLLQQQQSQKSNNKDTSIERDQGNDKQFALKDFKFSNTSSSQSLNNIPEKMDDVPSFSKSQSHQNLNKVISSSVQVIGEDGQEFTVSIVSNKRSSINQSKTILKKSLMGSPTSSALAKAGSVKKSQRRISFKDKIEEVYNFQPDQSKRQSSRSPLSKGLPRSTKRIDMNGPYFNSLKKYPGIQNNEDLLQQYNNKGITSSCWNPSETEVKDSNLPVAQKQEKNHQKPSVLQRRNSKPTTIEDSTSSKSFIKPLTFIPSSTNSCSSKNSAKTLSFLEYSKINKKNE